MGSSESTPSPSGRRPPRVLLTFLGDDDPRVCTGLRLIRFGRAVRVAQPERLQPPPIVLDPHAGRVLSTADAPVARRGGILAVDCSWNQIAARGRFPLARPRARPNPLARRLPFLLAANPQHYGRLGELNTVEALSAATFLLGFPRDAELLLQGFRGGPAFLEINRSSLDRFAAAATSEEAVDAERAIYGGGPEAGVAAPRRRSSTRSRAAE